MKWSDLSNDAKSIIEWVENPFTDRKETVKIEIGQVFHKKCPIYCDYNGDPNVNILVTEELYQEILKYVTEDDNIQCEQFLNGLSFKLKENGE